MMRSEVIIIGAGAAGLFCAALLGQRGFAVTVVDNGKKVGRKILMSGGGKCNFTNLTIDANHYLSTNPHFCKSALKRFTQWDFIELVNKYQIPYHEKDHGQLFCDDSAQRIVDMLVAECQKGGVKFQMQTAVTDIHVTDTHITDTQVTGSGFSLTTSQGELLGDKVVVATGGLSMPALGMTTIGYKIAEKFNLPVVPLRAGLVPFTLHSPLREELASLAGVAVKAEVRLGACDRKIETDVVTHSTANISFKENILFTHRGLSGPAILQISSYWQVGQAVVINLLPDIDPTTLFEQNRNMSVKNCLATQLPKRLVELLIKPDDLADRPIKQLTHQQRAEIITLFTAWQITPNGTEGYRTAEVTLGGVSSDALSSKTMMAKTVPNLYFIGEVVDVTGWLGGYNFQWAWSSAAACATEMV
ncbi:NAD(P)/FAD-dependent oxidoreductase [Orbaceae bacterium ESL0721]|nr:NAD(P)/FAD-dependent oxidoreductase [Orbaceae bacterium ESL0721]